MPITQYLKKEKKRKKDIIIIEREKKERKTWFSSHGHEKAQQFIGCGEFQILKKYSSNEQITKGHSTY